jgi:ribose 5-phosphate isomerase B
VALRFSFIAEAEARQIPHGATVELDPGGHVTPLAWDTLRARRVTVVPRGAADPTLPPDLAPVSPAARVAIAADASGLALKATIVGQLRRTGRAVQDLGVLAADQPGDYPELAAAVARAVSRGEADAGIVIDEGGVGAAVAANKVRGIRAALCTTPTLARLAREQAGTNVLTLASALLEPADALEIVQVWLSTPTRDPAHLRRLLGVRRLEDGL